MSPQLTVVNRRQWPVPLPGTGHGQSSEESIEHIRQQLVQPMYLCSSGPGPIVIRLRTYVWEDILCLRQSCREMKSGFPDYERRESTRLEEWKIDVPTMATIYHKASTIACYMNGIGRPFLEDGWLDPRHWVNRVWTLQEYVSEGKVVPIVVDKPADFTKFNKVRETC